MGLRALAGGVLPCGRFGANAAWFRLAVLTYNVLTALKRLALPAELLAARPKRLRFLIFNTPGKLVRHARQLILRLTHGLNRFGNWRGALARLPLPSPSWQASAPPNTHAALRTPPTFKTVAVPPSRRHLRTDYGMAWTMHAM